MSTASLCHEVVNVVAVDGVLHLNTETKSSSLVARMSLACPKVLVCIWICLSPPSDFLVMFIGVRCFSLCFPLFNILAYTTFVFLFLSSYLLLPVSSRPRSKSRLATAVFCSHHAPFF